MLDGKYKSCLVTQMGRIDGTITLQTNGNNVLGILETMGIKNQFQGTKIQENECNFKGNFNTIMGQITYNANIVINGNDLVLITNTNKGNFKIQGKRI